MQFPSAVRGDELGVMFPTSVDHLIDQGADFLTRAFSASGVLKPGNSVTAITDWREFFGGGMGRKLLLTVAYADPHCGLDSNLFVKFPREFGDPLRALFGPLMQPEVRFALLSRTPDFPIAVPRCYFADYHAETVSGILITERIAYGTGRIEPAHEKCLDYEAADLLGHYRALTVAMAHLAGAQHAKRLPAHIELDFPFDRDAVDTGARIPYNAAQFEEKLEKLKWFASVAPQLFEPQLLRDNNLARFCREAVLVLQQEQQIRSMLNGRSDCIALCHWNMNIDNAWFWRDEDGILQAGLLDWGSVGQMNLAQAFFGMTCAAETGFLNAHRRDLLQLLVDEYAASGGPTIPLEDIVHLQKLAVALLGVAWILDAPSLIAAEIPDFASLTGRTDPRLRDNFLARAQHQLLMVFLSEWMSDDIGSALANFAATQHA